MLNNITVPPLPSIFIGKDVINSRVTLYMQGKHEVLSQAMSTGGTTRQETKFVWYSREHVETWISEMDLMNADGMRVYFGTYAQEDGATAGQLCLLMVLTRASENGTVHNDIILEDEELFPLRIATPQERTIEINPGNNGEKTREYNYGAPCPPACPTNGVAFPQ